MVRPPAVITNFQARFGRVLRVQYPRLAAPAPASDTDTVTDTLNLITAKLAKVHEMLVERLVALSFDISISFAYNHYNCLLPLFTISRDI